MKNLFTNLMKNTAKRTQNTGGGTSQSNSQSENTCKKGYEHVNQSRLASDMPPTCLPLDSLSIVSRQSDLRTYRAKSSCETFSVGQCSPHTFPFEAKSQLASSHQSDFFTRLWKYAAMILMVLCLGTGEMWADVVSKNTSTPGTIIYSNINSSGSNVSISAGSEENGFAAVGSNVSFKKGPDCISVPSDGYFMVCVDDITSGTVSMTMSKSGTAPDWSSTSDGSDGRYFQLYVDDTAKKKFLYSKYSASAVLADPDVTGLTYENSKIRGLRQFDFTSSDLTTVSTKKYLKFKALGGEMKPFGIKIVQTAPSGPSVSSFTPASGSKLKTGATVTVAGSSGSTVYCLWASSAQTASAIKSGTAGSSGAASVTSVGIASANGTTLYAVAVKDATDSDVSSATYTIDDTAPTLSSSTPADGANNIPLSGNIVLTFNENVTINDASKFSLSGGSGTLSTGSATASTNTVTIPYSGLSSATTYTFSSAAGAVKDEAGNTSAALSDIAFTTYRCAVTSCGNADITYTINGGASGDHSTGGADLISDATPSNTTALDASTTPTYTGISMSSLTKKAAAKSNYCSETPNMSGKIGVYNGSSYSSSNYLQFTFTVKSGYTFTPCDIQFVVQPVDAVTNFRWEITDGSSSYGYGIATGVDYGSNVGATVLTGLSSTSEMADGTYYIRLYPYTSAASKTFRIGEDVILRGTTAEAASCTTSPTVTAGSNSSVTATTATVSCASGISSLGSAGCSISEYGFVIGTSTTPAIGGDGVTKHVVGTTYTTTDESFEKALTGLTAGTTYYVRPYATNGNGTSYGTETSFTTLPSTPTFSPTSGSTVSGSQKITITGHSGSTVYYAWATSAQTADDIYNSGSGSHGTAEAGTASVDVVDGKTLYAISRLNDDNSAVGSASYTVDATAPTLSSSTPANGATDVDVSGTIVLTFSETIASVDATKFTLTNATKGDVAIDGSDATKVNIAYSGADNETTVTLATAAAAVTDAVGNASAALSNISFTTVAETPTLTALVAGTLYEVPDMIPSGESLSSSDQFFEGLSANTKFELIGSASSSTTPKVNNSSTNDKTIAGIAFDDGSMWFKGTASLTSNIPTTFGLSFIVPGTGKLYLYFDDDDTSTNIKLAKSGATGAKPTVSSGYSVVDVTEGTYYMYGTGTTAPYSFYGLKFVPTYAITLHDNNGGEANGSAKVEANGKTLLDISAPTRTGYEIEGYYGEAGCTTKIATAAGALQASKSVSEVEYTNSSSQWTKGSGATLYANWTVAVYNITYKDCGDVSFSGVHGDGYPTTHTYGTATDLVAPTKEGCEFLGWFTDATGTSSAGASIGGTAKTADFTLYAKWGVTIDESDFYQLYAMESKTRDQLITAASLPSYISTNITADATNNTFASAPTLTTPHDFSAIGTTKNYHIKTANTNTITITAVANVKTVRLYGYGSSKTVTATAINQSGGSNLSISNGTINASGNVVEASFNISGASGYSSSAYYTITLTFPGDVHLFGVYIETASVYPVTGVSLNKSSTTLTVGDTEQLTATIAPANATNKGMSWVSSNTSAATVSSSGLITAEAEGETTITVTTSDGYYTATCDVTVEAFSCAKFAGKIFDLTVTTSSASYTIGGGTEQNLSSDATIMDDCSAYMGKLGSSTSGSCISSTKLQLAVSSDADKYVKITPKCALRNGDVISCTGSSREIAFSTTKAKVTAPSTSSYSYTVTPGDGLAGASTIYVWGATNSATVGTLTITRPTSYIMTYNPNGGRDEVDAERFAAGANTLTTDVPTRAGYIFEEWNTQADGEGTGYVPGAAYTMPASASELFAKWVEPDYSEEYAYVILTSNTTANTKNATALIGGLKTNTEPPYQLDGNNDYFGITLATNFVAGDKVQFKLKKGSKDGGNIYKGTTSSDGLLTSFSGLSSGDNTYEIDITAAMIEGGLTKTLAFVRTSSDYNHEVYWIKVLRKHCVNFMALKDGVTTWSTTASDWIGPDGAAVAMPGINDVVYVDKNITVTSNAAKAKDVILGDGKSLTIAATGGLVVAGTVTTSGGSATTPSDLVILSDEDGTGALITGERSTTTQATVGFYTKAIQDAERGYVNQYIGIPFSGITAYDRFYDTYIYEYIASSNAWSPLTNNGEMSPYTAYNLMRDEDTETTLYSGGTLVLPGTSAEYKDKELTLTLRNASATTTNMFANPYTAPIDITSFAEGEAPYTTPSFDGVEATIYIFNAGSKYDVDNRAEQAGAGAGQWLVLPVASVKASPGSYAVTTIPSQQAFMVKGAEGATHKLTIDYKKHVYDPAKTSGATINPTRAPKRVSEETTLETMNLIVRGAGGAADRVLMFMREDFSIGFDNGWDGRKMKGKTYAPYLYAATDDGKMAVNSIPTAEGTVLGFKAGTEDNYYTFSFNYNGEDNWYLNDIKEQKSTLINAAETYEFVAEPGDTETRFVISATPIHKITTGNESASAEAAKVRKLIIDDKIYIIRGGRMYSVDGQMIK